MFSFNPLLVISLFSTLILTASLFYYFNTKFTYVEKAISQQNLVLAELINDFKQGHIGGASKEANIAAKNFLQQSETNNTNSSTVQKIEVSDDEINSSDSNSESDFSLDEGEVTDKEELEAEITDKEELEAEIKELPETTENHLEAPIINVLKNSMSEDNNPSSVANDLFSQIIDSQMMNPLSMKNAGAGVVVISNQNLDINTNILDPSSSTLNIVNLEEVEDKNQFEVFSENIKAEDLNSKDVKSVIVEDDFQKYKVSELKDMALKRGLNISGKSKKNDLIALLNTA